MTAADKTSSKRALAARRRACAAERLATEAGRCDAPWSLGNIRTWQRVMCDALAERSRILKTYLVHRQSRTHT